MLRFSSIVTALLTDQISCVLLPTGDGLLPEFHLGLIMALVVGVVGVPGRGGTVVARLLGDVQASEVLEVLNKEELIGSQPGEGSVVEGRA